MTENRSGNLLLTVIMVATLLVAIIGTSFAFFALMMSEEETINKIILGAGNLDIHYASGTANIEITNITAQDEELVIEKEFSIKGNNSANTVMPYALNLIIMQNDFRSGAISYSLTATNVDGGAGTLAPEVIEPRELMTFSDDDNYIISLGEGSFAGVVNGSVHTYILRIFFNDEDTSSNHLFAASIQTIVLPAYTR